MRVGDRYILFQCSQPLCDVFKTAGNVLLLHATPTIRIHGYINWSPFSENAFQKPTCVEYTWKRTNTHHTADVVIHHASILREVESCWKRSMPEVHIAFYCLHETIDGIGTMQPRPVLTHPYRVLSHKLLQQCQ